MGFVMRVDENVQRMAFLIKFSFFVQILISVETRIIYLGQENIGTSVFRPIFS